MTREEAIRHIRDVIAENNSIKPNIVTFEQEKEALYMAIEALSKPNYESDTEVRLAVTDRNKDKVVLWDAFGELEYYPCDTSETQFYDEDDYWNGRVPTHGRLIDADALYASIAKDTYLLTDRINSRDYGMFLVGIKQKIDEAPTVQADRPHGEWIEREDWNGDSYYDCSVCGESFVLYDGTPSMNLYHFCPNCGADMRKETE